MSEMINETPIYPLGPAERQKKRKLQFEDSPPGSPDFFEAAMELTKDDSLPLHVRTIIAYLVDSRKGMDDLMQSNHVRAAPASPQMETWHRTMATFGKKWKERGHLSSLEYQKAEEDLAVTGLITISYA
ncbi:unnamed protein product [Cylicocyclus nassatus]|uniref:Uncharacterized protein n=1 Tax=Cylicocyclus nassatus TaxID=53992 RepID=A0AA36H457_CYLNA|nr:unnamed protein product [Cylicocyclus nassatus]